MKKTNLANILILLTAFTLPVSADDIPATNPSMDTSGMSAISAVPSATTPPPPATTAPAATPTAAATGTPNTSDIATTQAAVTGAAGNSATTDPTLAFFTALGACTPGKYQEKNIIANEVGQPMLNQEIIGPSNDQLSCNVKLSTPDNRTMDCAFPMDSLSMFSDQHFLQGMMSDTIDSPSQDAVSADMNWSQMKAQNCSFSD